jgi:gamma-glutamyl hercynylcysteine S-oxide hydrolase
MCRHAAYLGPEIALAQLLLTPPHSLEVQAWAPKELRYARLNADGFGFGWYGVHDGAVRYVNDMPIWSDVNLPTLAENLQSDLWIAAVRSATPGLGSGPVNTQPFADGDYLFSHNGYLEGFVQEVRPEMQRWLSPEVESAIIGTTDSEYLFAVVGGVLCEEGERALGSRTGRSVQPGGRMGRRRDRIAQCAHE